MFAQITEDSATRSMSRGRGRDTTQPRPPGAGICPSFSSDLPLELGQLELTCQISCESRKWATKAKYISNSVGFG